MSKFVGLYLILIISCSGAHYGIFEGNEDEDLDVDDPEIDPAFVEEPGCPVVSALRNITIKEVPYLHKIVSQPVDIVCNKR